MAFTPKNLKDYLVRARLSKVDQESSNNRGTARCHNGNVRFVETILLWDVGF